MHYRRDGQEERARYNISYDGSIMCGLNAVLINTINSRVRNDRYCKSSNLFINSSIDNDYTERAGGLMMFFTDDLPQCRCYNLEEDECKSGRIETIVIELIL